MKHLTIQRTITALLCSLLFAITFLLTTSPAHAQSEATQIEQSLKKLSPEEIEKYQAVLAKPLETDSTFASLDAKIDAKLTAAYALGDNEKRLAVLREAVTFSKTVHYKTTLARQLAARGDFDSATKLQQLAIDQAGNNIDKSFYTSMLASYAFDQNKDKEGIEILERAKTILSSVNATQSWAVSYSSRTASDIAAIEARLAMRQGKFLQAISAAGLAVKEARASLRYPDAREVFRNYQYQRLIQGLQLQIEAFLVARRIQDAEIVATELVRVFRENEIATVYRPVIFGSIADLRYTEREFNQAESAIRKTLTYSQKESLATWAQKAQAKLANILIGQHRYPEALAEFQKLDQLAGDDEKLKARVRYAFDRAVVYLYNNKALEASPLLASEAQALARQYGIGLAGRQHFFTAQASGLQGVALWRVGSAASKAQAYPLLQAAVRDIMAPENVDYLENIGIRKELREMIFSTYIEAAAQTSHADALAALGIADWLRGGLVQEALGDAAVRAAASNEALSSLVRQDQDARNEIKGLRNFLSGEAGSTASPLPEVAAKMRERIALLEKSRADAQVQIKAAFPDYERLVRPSPPSTADIQAKLKADEALVVLQPSADAVYVWAISKDTKEGAGSFYRANVTSTQLAALVRRLRANLDVAGIDPSRRPAFDHAAAQDLYAKLLAPVQQRLAGKTSLIVAAGGVLGQIPFGVLETGNFSPSTGSGRTVSDAPWLIKQAAITHVPSVAAWLSMRALPHQTAPQPMLAWGDPLFNLALASNTASKGEVRKVDLTRASTAVDLEKEDPHSALKYANIPALPETRDELMAIAKTLGADAAKDLILGSKATRESVLAENKNGELAKRRVVAFATHGLMAGDLPNLTQPALAMAGTKDDATNVLAPLLTLEDVLTLKLNADWVVLSACNTAAADGKAEEALSGLARGFFYAGSRSLLVTHWAVDSESAVQLTTETFKNYQSKPTEAKAESLRQAMLTVMANPATAHPTYWAPYALVGDGAR